MATMIIITSILDHVPRPRTNTQAEHFYDRLKCLIALECHKETSARIHEKAQNG